MTWTREDFSYLLLTLALTLFAVAPLTYPGYLQVHSGFAPVYNLAGLASKPLSPGWTPGVATTPDLLRGDGLLAYYLALPLVRLGGTAVDGVKVIFALSLFLGAAGVYVWLRGRLGPGGASLAALVYTYLPYHLAAVYVRGAWGETLFLGLLPWAMASTAPDRSQWSPKTSRVLRAALMGLAWALLGLGQAGLAMWAFLLLVAWVLWVDHRGRSEAGERKGQSGAGERKGRSGVGDRKGQSGVGDRKGRPYATLLVALGGTVVGLSLTFMVAGFFLPQSPIVFFEHFLFPAQLFSAFWGFGASRPGWDDGLALGLGFAALGLAMLTLTLATTKANGISAAGRDESPNPSDAGPEESAQEPARVGFGNPTRAAFLRLSSPEPLRVLVVALALTWLLLGPSALLWRLTGLYHTLTYPWQLLGLTGLCLSVLAGSSVTLDRRLAAPSVYAGLVILTLLASYSYLEPRFTRHTPGTGPLAAWDGHRLMLLDYDLSVAIPPAAAGLSQATSGRLPVDDYGTPRPGDTLHLRLTWQATRPFYQDLKLFVHLLDASGQVIAQADPLAGRGAGAQGEDYLTSQWEPGELILDEVGIPIPPDAPPGPYQLALGLYAGETLERLPLVGQKDGRMIVEVGSRK